ncbi:unnamed protein product [Pleuronectes platessa]|uniref:Uncharacterized protein n=1 Tax=Pleuronectes platessa TaxID=8262 RepID=A0A9N7Z7V1_PLEPL|nr:unnamed protein product [Pleuronectes platessa]
MCRVLCLRLKQVAGGEVTVQAKSDSERRSNLPELKAEPSAFLFQGWTTHATSTVPPSLPCVSDYEASLASKSKMSVCVCGRRRRWASRKCTFKVQPLSSRSRALSFINAVNYSQSETFNHGFLRPPARWPDSPTAPPHRSVYTGKASAKNYVHVNYCKLLVVPLRRFSLFGERLIE